MSAPELHVMEWQHPRRGRVRETVCPQHESDVLASLRVLGIGSTGRLVTANDAQKCLRCSFPHRQFRSLLPFAAVQP